MTGTAESTGSTSAGNTKTATGMIVVIATGIMTAMNTEIVITKMGTEG
jgi:hypothetical protein